MRNNTLQNKELAQNRPDGTSATQVYQPDNYAEISVITITNTTASAVDYSMYIDQNGTTYDESTAIAFSVELPANSTTIWDLENPIPLFSNGNLAIQSSVADALNFSIYGHEKVQR